jgi:hypothetical protein
MPLCEYGIFLCYVSCGRMLEETSLLTTSAIMTTTTMQAAPLAAAASIFTAHNVLVLFGVWLAFKLLQALYNVSSCHPLHHIPGPRLAAASYWPEFYHDVVRFGCYTKEIRRMHERYGKSIKQIRAGRM